MRITNIRSTNRDQLNNVSSGLVVNKAIIEQRVKSELPFMATENVIMAMVERGFSRQETHEEIRYVSALASQGSQVNLSRVLSQEAGAVVKQEGKPNDLLERIEGRQFFKPILPELAALIDPGTFTGRSAQLVERLISTKVSAALEKYKNTLENVKDAELSV